jgi:hypothetical protein
MLSPLFAPVAIRDIASSRAALGGMGHSRPPGRGGKNPIGGGFSGSGPRGRHGDPFSRRKTENHHFRAHDELRKRIKIDVGFVKKPSGFGKHYFCVIGGLAA